jgi:hypothetical protein
MPRSTRSGSNSLTFCPRCGRPLASAILVCPDCGGAAARSTHATSELDAMSTGTRPTSEALVTGTSSSMQPGVVSATARTGRTHGGTVLIECGSREGASSESGSPPDATRGFEATLVGPDGTVIPIRFESISCHIVLGRDAGQCDIAVSDPRVSRAHALMGCDGQSCWIEDLASANGTFLNGTRLSAASVLSSGDTIRIGRTELAYRCESVMPNR